MANGLRAGLLGMFQNPQQDQMQALLGQYYDPRQAAKQQLWGMVRGLGQGLMNQGPSKTPINFGTTLGSAVQGGIEGSDQAVGDYQQKALLGYKMAGEKRDEDWQAKERARKESGWASEDASAAQMNALIGSIQNPQERLFAQLNPEAYVKAKLNPEMRAIPAGIQEYEYAKRQGFPGTFQDWEASKKGGMSLQVDPATGQVTFQQGSNIKPLTEAQSKDTVYATRAEGALKNLDMLEKGLTGWQGTGGNSVGQTPIVGNFMKTGEYQRAEQAANEFLQAILRKDTGSAITPGEQALYGNTYLPKPGDTVENLAQKRAARARAVDAIKAGMTPQAILAQEQALAKGEARMIPGQGGGELEDALKMYGQ